jgi:hydroxymethylpyrimidine/phosphomethylpyrimidine kinase
MDRPRVLVVAGYDQSAGAGVLSDIKTLEAHEVYGYAAVTGLTFQNERTISRVEWLTLEDIYEQIDLCFTSADFEWVKMGITSSLGMAGAIIDHIRKHNKGVRVVLDPVIRASSGREFWARADRREWEEVAARCFVVTPNWDEIRWLYPGEDIRVRCAELTRGGGVNIFLKGGHSPEHPGRDYLWIDGEAEILDVAGTGGALKAEGQDGMVVVGNVSPKHGSGCVLSSAMAANLALGYPLPVAAERAKRYIERFLASNKTLLGWH